MLVTTTLGHQLRALRSSLLTLVSALSMQSQSVLVSAVAASTATVIIFAAIVASSQMLTRCQHCYHNHYCYYYYHCCSLVHISKVQSGAKLSAEELKERFTVGQEVQCRILSVSADTNKLSLTMLEPEKQADLSKFADLPEGTWLDGTVMSITQYGAFINLKHDGEDVDGMAHISELSEERLEAVTDAVNVGDQVKVRAQCGSMFTVIAVMLDWMACLFVLLRSLVGHIIAASTERLALAQFDNSTALHHVRCTHSTIFACYCYYCFTSHHTTTAAGACDPGAARAEEDQAVNEAARSRRW
jgi:predicted RNA-binding protein with RPS1 domain